MVCDNISLPQSIYLVSASFCRFPTWCATNTADIGADVLSIEIYSVIHHHSANACIHQFTIYCYFIYVYYLQLLTYMTNIKIPKAEDTQRRSKGKGKSKSMRYYGVRNATPTCTVQCTQHRCMWCVCMFDGLMSWNNHHIGIVLIKRKATAYQMQIFISCIG